MKEFGDTPATPNVFDTDDVFTLSPSEIVELSNFWDDVQNGQTLDAADVPDAVQIFVKGMEDPTVQADAIGALMSPECANVLEDALDQTWSPDLDAGLKEQLSEIAKLDTPKQIQTLCWLIQESNKVPENIPASNSLPENSPPVANDPVTRWRARSYNYEIAPKIEQAYRQGELSNNPDFARALREGDTAALTTVIELAEDPNVGKQALELLYAQGSDIVPYLKELAPEGSRAEQMIEAIITGEKPDFTTTTLAIENTLSQVVENKDVDALKQLVEQTTSRASLVESIAAKGDEVSPMLVEMLGDSDRRVQVFAMDTLHLQGDEAIDDLVRAKAHPNPDVKSNAEILLHTHFTGEANWENVEMNYQYDNPFTESRYGGNGGSDIGISTFSLDVDDLTERLSNSETHLEALSSLIQVGQPAMPALCQVLISTRRKNRERH